MRTHVAERKAGQFAAERYNARHRAWLRRVWSALPLVALPMAAILVSFGLFFYSRHMEFLLGLGWAPDSRSQLPWPSHHPRTSNAGSRAPKANERQHEPCGR